LWVVPGAQPVMDVLLRWRGVGDVRHLDVGMDILVALRELIMMKHLCSLLQLAAVERLALEACIEDAMPALLRLPAETILTSKSVR